MSCTLSSLLKLKPRGYLTKSVDSVKIHPTSSMRNPMTSFCHLLHLFVGNWCTHDKFPYISKILSLPRKLNFKCKEIKFDNLSLESEYHHCICLSMFLFIF